MNCGNLLAIHLNDLEFNNCPEMKEEADDIFQIQTNHELKHAHQGGLPTAFKMFINKQRGAKYVLDKVEKINYKEVLRKALTKPSDKDDNQRNLLLGLHM